MFKKSSIVSFVRVNYSIFLLFPLEWICHSQMKDEGSKYTGTTCKAREIKVLKTSDGFMNFGKSYTEMNYLEPLNSKELSVDQVSEGLRPAMKWSWMHHYSPIGQYELL